VSSAIANADSITVVIPAAGSVPEGILALSSISCPAMIPVADRPVIYWTMSYLRALGLRRFVIAVGRRGMFVEDFVDCTFGQDSDIQFVVPTRATGVGRTLLDLLELVETPAALAVLGDTHFQFANGDAFDAKRPWVLTYPVRDSYRWCIAETDGSNEVLRLKDKVSGLPPDANALIGVYYFPDVATARAIARDSVTTAEAAGRPPELAAILDGLRAEAGLVALRAGEWSDVGNSDRLALSHQRLLQKRAFNELRIDPTFGTVTKRSQDVEKFIDEVNYLRLLPQELQVLFPRVLEASTDWNEPYVTLEYYGYPALSGVFVFENVDAAIWEQVFLHLRDVLTRGFMRYKRPLSAQAVTQMYLTKTRARLQNTRSSPLADLYSHEGKLVVNGRPMANLPLRWAQIEHEVTRLAEGVEATVIHGDFCLSNILYDLRARTCKLIDPRGSFGEKGIFGDPRYDVAKLFHSVYGLYDFIVNDLFHIEVEGQSITLDIRSRAQHDAIRRAMERVFFPQFDRRDVLLITALIFAGIPALHYDAPRRQLAMYARSLQLLHEYFEGEPA
jgi:dTDP-glucose pyrophosphorylase